MRASYEMPLDEFKRLSPDEQARNLAIGAAEIAGIYPEVAHKLLQSVQEWPPTPRLLNLQETIRENVRPGAPS